MLAEVDLVDLVCCPIDPENLAESFVHLGGFFLNARESAALADQYRVIPITDDIQPPSRKRIGIRLMDRL